jgi:hypothetical protein
LVRRGSLTRARFQWLQINHHGAKALWRDSSEVGMNGLGLDELTTRSQLRTKRDLLFKRFFRNPSMTWLAIEISQ